jgi:hypothetical protein
LISPAFRRNPGKKAEQNKNRSASRHKPVEQQIKLTEGNVNGVAVFSKIGKTVAKQVGGGSDNQAINFNNPPDAPKRKIKMPSRKF